MSADELRPILTAYRRQVEKAWSEDTCHPDYLGFDGQPDGQCGVTSVWLQERLLEDHDITSTFCVGTVLVNGQVAESNHCWLEIGTGPHRIIVDLTADQLRGMESRPVVCFTDRDLVSGDILYLARAEDLESDCAERLALLKEAL